MTVHHAENAAEYANRGLPFATSEERKAFMVEMKAKLANVETEDDIDSLIDEHGWKFQHLGPAQNKAMNELLIEAKNQFSVNLNAVP